MKFHQPEYDHVFRDVPMHCLVVSAADFKEITISPSDKPGYSHFCRIDLQGISETREGRPMRNDAISYFLREWGFPAENSEWESTTAREPEIARRVKTTKNPVVYFLKAGPFIKIGFTAGDPSSRIEDLITGCPFDIEIIATMRGDYKLERSLHQRFSKLRSRGEWFHARPELLNFIQSNARAA